MACMLRPMGERAVTGSAPAGRVTLDPDDGGTGYAAAWAARPDAVKVFP